MSQVGLVKRDELRDVIHNNIFVFQVKWDCHPPTFPVKFSVD